MKTITDQLSTYKSVHLNKNNVKTHVVGVPLILWSIALLLDIFALFVLKTDEFSIRISFLPIVASIVFIYYLLLDRFVGVFAIMLLVPLFYSATLFSQSDNALWISIGVFVVGWVIQFIGHHYEKAKPAFVDDLNQLLIGPIFLIAEFIFALGMKADLEKTVHEIAIEKRKAFEIKKKADNL